LTIVPWNSTSPIREPPDRLWPEANQPSGKKAVFAVPPLTVNEFELYVPLWLPIIDRVLAKVATIATPETILRWYRELVVKKYDERNHQGLGNALIDGEQQDVAGAVRIVRRERLGGLLSFYHRKTAVRERIE